MYKIFEANNSIDYQCLKLLIQLQKFNNINSYDKKILIISFWEIYSIQTCKKEKFRTIQKSKSKIIPRDP